MTFRRTRFLSSEGATIQGAQGESVAANIRSRARVYSSQRVNDFTSMGESFQILRPSVMRSLRRRSCSSGLTSSQNFSRMIPDSVSMRSNSGVTARNLSACSSVQKPITRSTPARLYQLRSKITTSPADGRWRM